MVRFRSESLLDTDPCDMLPDSELPTTDDWNLPATLAEVLAYRGLRGQPR